MYQSDKNLIPEDVKNSYKSIIKKTNNLIKNGPNIWIDTSLKKMYECQKGTWGNAQNH